MGLLGPLEINIMKLEIHTKILALVVFIFLVSCKQDATKTYQAETIEKTPFKYSLAQWSFHEALQSGQMDNLDFAQAAADLGFEGVEYVSQFFQDKAEDIQYLNEMKAKADEAGIKNVLIMVDDEGDLAHQDSLMRDQYAQGHFKWVDAAKYLGCHAIRVNLFGEMHDRDAWIKYATDGLGKLAKYGEQEKIHVLVENHGWMSSDASAVVEVIKNINNPFCGTLPDFGNFCTARKDNELWGDDICIKEYDKYKGVEELLPYAKALSAKSYDFDSLGNETKIDYSKMMDLVKAANYTGYIGVEFESIGMPEKEGILATKKLLQSLE